MCARRLNDEIFTLVLWPHRFMTMKDMQAYLALVPEYVGFYSAPLPIHLEGVLKMRRT